MTSRLQPEFAQIDPYSYLDLAKQLASRLEPSARRSAADRAYYAAFLYSRDQLAARGYITPYYTAADHKYVAETLKSELGAFGNDEFRLRNARNKATYDTRDLSSPTLKCIIDTAENIIRQVSALPQHP